MAAELVPLESASRARPEVKERESQMFLGQLLWIASGIFRVAMGYPPLKDEDPMDTLDTEIAKITKKLAENRKEAIAQLTLLRSKKAVPKPTKLPPGVQVKWTASN